MIKRTLTGACIVAITVGFFFLRKIDVRYFDILILALAIIGTIEMVRVVDKLTVTQKILTCLLPILFFECWIFLSWKVSLYIAVGFFLVSLALLVIDHKHTTLSSVAYSFLCAIYPSCFLIPCLLANSLQSNSLIALILIFLISPCADTMAYVVGITFKGKKMCPTISPKKTISGGIGGLIGGILGSLILYFIVKGNFVFGYSFPQWLFFALVGLFGAVLTEFGDLVESVIKRQLGIKDMGNLLPGHGGIMDRIDGLLFASPFVFFVFPLI